MTENSGVIKYLMRWFNMCECILYSSLEIFFCLNGTRKITGQLPKYPFTVTETIEYSVCTIEYSVCTIEYSVCTIEYSVCTIEYSVCTIEYSVCTIEYSVCTIEYSVCTIVHYRVQLTE